MVAFFCADGYVGNGGFSTYSENLVPVQFLGMPMPASRTSVDLYRFECSHCKNVLYMTMISPV